MDLAKIIVPSKTIWDEFPGYPGFKVQISYLTRDELMKIRSKALTSKVSRKTRQVEEELDSELFQKLYIQAVIKGWEGLKYEYLAKMVPVDLSQVPEGEEELEFSISNAEVLMKNASGFDAWVTDVLDDVQNFTQGS